MLTFLAARIARESDPINAGNISTLAFRRGYVVFKVLNGSKNYCAPSSCMAINSQAARTRQAQYECFHTIPSWIYSTESVGR